MIYICDEAAKFVWCGLEGFYPPKTAGKVDPSVFQDLLSNSVNLKAFSIIDLIWCDRAGSSNGPSRFTELLSDFIRFSLIDSLMAPVGRV